MEHHLEYPEKFKQITSHQEFLEQPSYQVDMALPGIPEMLTRIARQMEEILFIDPAKGNVDGNIIGFGLAACQLESIQNNKPPALTLDEGLDIRLNPLNNEGQAPRFGIIRIPKMGKESKELKLNMVNPQILNMSVPRSFKHEGCLSFPGQWKTTLRNRHVQFGFVDGITLEPREMEVYGLEAIVIQHELDHQEGVLFFHHERKSVVADKKVNPNEPCPCGSGKKYKKCCAQ